MADATGHHVFRYGGEFADFVIDRAEGARIYDADGRAVLDFTSGQMSGILGHAHPEIVAVVRDAIGRLDHVHSSFLSTPAIDLAARLTGVLPAPLERVLPLSTGGESNEAALRIAKTVTGGFEVVGLHRSWHGVTGGAGSVTFNGARTGHGPAIPGALALPTPDAYRSPFARDGHYDWRAELDFGFDMVDRQSVGALAAVIAEPILSSAGIIVPPDGYLAALAGKCAERGMLLILDEAQTGLGRTGDLFAFERDGVVPDILTLSKTLGAGLPLSAVVTSADVEALCQERGFVFYTTHAADPLPASVGAKVVEIIVRDRLAERARSLGAHMMDELRSLMQRHEVIGDVRGRGLLIGIELVEDRRSKKPALELGLAVSRRCLELGASLNISRRSVANIFRIAPPLTVSQDDVDLALTILDQALTECAH